jgi:hypothetical protein
MRKWAILAICLALSGHAEASIKYYSGQDYLDLDEGMRGTYTAGAIDALSATNLLPWLDKCIEGWKLGQVKAVLDKYFKDHPEKWNSGAAGQLPFAVARVCPSADAEFKK